MSNETVKSCYESQDDILNAIQKLYCPEGYHCDLTYGNGVFWKNIKRPSICCDVDPKADFVRKESSTATTIDSNALSNVVFDPPFLTYIKNGRGHQNGGVIMSKRFGGYYSYDDLENHYDESLKEMSRILKNNGKLIFKCQDIIHNHKMHPTHCMVINMAEKYNLRLLDMFILVANHRMPMPQEKMPNYKQKHARIYHSYFLVFEKVKVRIKKDVVDKRIDASLDVLDSQDWELKRNMKRNSKKWKEVLERGCGGYCTNTTNGMDYGCKHEYDWNCDDCPCCIVKQEEKYKNETVFGTEEEAHLAFISKCNDIGRDCNLE